MVWQQWVWWWEVVVVVVRPGWWRHYRVVPRYWWTQGFLSLVLFIFCKYCIGFLVCAWDPHYGKTRGGRGYRKKRGLSSINNDINTSLLFNLAAIAFFFAFQGYFVGIWRILIGFSLHPTRPIGCRRPIKDDSCITRVWKVSFSGYYNDIYARLLNYPPPLLFVFFFV